MMQKFTILILLLLYTGSIRGQSTNDANFPLLGKVQPRHSLEIAASNWSIGGETMDRDYTDFNQWREYLGPLGAKKIRLQAGWAKCEPEKGQYDFEWLDEIIDGVIAQGVEPWLQTSYGNPIYEGGGDIYLSGGFPTSEEALAAWDRWIYQLVRRYKGRVNIWEIWNESDLNNKNIPEAYAKLFVRTAEIIRSEIPDAQIYALSLANPNRIEYVRSFLQYLKTYDQLDLVDVITLHGYTKRPEDNYAAYERMRRMIQSFSGHIVIGQGELGCPSENQPYYALSNYPWTETSQSKWLLRRLLGDLGRDIPSLYFTIIDMNYIRRYENKNGVVTELKEPIITVNRKGLIRSNKDNSVDYLKPAYYTFQNLTAIFDHSLVRIPNYAYTAGSDASLSVYGYRTKGFDYQAVVIWMDGEIPGNDNDKTPVDFTFPAGNFREPVFVDIRTGEVYAIPDTNWKRNGTAYTFTGIPAYDSPVLIADRSLVPLPEQGKNDGNQSGH